MSHASDMQTSLMNTKTNTKRKQKNNKQTKKNDQQNILVATISLDKTVSLKHDEKINQVILV